MMRIRLAVPETARMITGIQRCCKQVEHLGEAPRRVLVLLGEQPADLLAELDRRDIHQHQRQQEGRDGEAEEAEEGDEIVADRIFAHRREDADRQRDRPGGEQRRQGQHERQRHALPDQVR